MKIELDYFGFNPEQKKNILKIVEELSSHITLTGHHGSIGSGGNHYHIALQRDDNSWIMFHSVTDAVTISDPLYSDFESLHLAFWDDQEKVTWMYPASFPDIENVMEDFKDVDAIVSDIKNKSYSRLSF